MTCPSSYVVVVLVAGLLMASYVCLLLIGDLTSSFLIYSLGGFKDFQSLIYIASQLFFSTLLFLVYIS